MADLDTKRLRELLAPASVTPWATVPSSPASSGGVAISNRYGGTVLRTATVAPHRKQEADAELIAAAVNALPDLLDELDRLRESKK